MTADWTQARHRKLENLLESLCWGSRFKRLQPQQVNATGDGLHCLVIPTDLVMEVGFNGRTIFTLVCASGTSNEFISVSVS